MAGSEGERRGTEEPPQPGAQQSRGPDFLLKPRPRPGVLDIDTEELWLLEGTAGKHLGTRELGPWSPEG